jgi:hypothetical protein
LPVCTCPLLKVDGIPYLTWDLLTVHSCDWSTYDLCFVVSHGGSISSLSFCSDGSHEQRNGRKFAGVGLAQWISAPIDLCFSNYSVSRQYKRKYHEQDLDSLHLLHVTTLLRITFYFLDYRWRCSRLFRSFTSSTAYAFSLSRKAQKSPEPPYC